MLLSVDLHEHSIDEESVTVSLVLSFQPPGVYGGELDAPKPDRFLTDGDAAFSE